MRSLTMLLAAALLTACASTQDTDRTLARAEANKIESIEQFLEYQRELRKSYEDGTRGPLSNEAMQLLVSSHQTLERILGGVESVEELTPDQRVEVYNAQSAIGSIVLGNIKDRPVCRRGVAKTGSNLRRTECYTASERERMRRQAERDKDYIRRQISMGIDGPRG